MSIKCKPSESLSCSCVDVGTIIDGSDCQVDFAQVYASRDDAQIALDYLSTKAKQAETDPCVIKSEIFPVEEGFQLVASFEFSCQAEAMIFQLSTR